MNYISGPEAHVNTLRAIAVDQDVPARDQRSRFRNASCEAHAEHDVVQPAL